MDDLISRQAAIDAVSKACFELRGVFERCKDALKALSTIEPRAKGEWIGLDSISDAYDEYCCPFCGKDIVVDTQYICDIGFTIEDFKFCLNCGADLGGENNG